MVDFLLGFFGQPEENVPGFTFCHRHASFRLLLVVVAAQHAARLGLVVFEIPLAGVVVLVVGAVALESERSVRLEVIPAQAPRTTVPGDRLAVDDSEGFGFGENHLCFRIASRRNRLHAGFLREGRHTKQAQKENGKGCKESFACRLTLHENLLKNSFMIHHLKYLTLDVIKDIQIVPYY